MAASMVHRHLCRIAWLALTCLSCSLPTMAQEPEATPTMAPQAEEDLIVDDFEAFAGTGAWNGFDASDEHVTSGEWCARWSLGPTTKTVVETSPVTDWSEHDTLCLSCYSEQATNAIIYLLVYSENPETQGIDYFYVPILVNWEGERELAIPFRAFRSNRSPQGWDAVDKLSFTVEWQGCRFVEGTVLYLDRMALRKQPAADRLVVSDLEFDIPTWQGLQPSSSMVAVGELSGAWLADAQTPHIRTTAIPHDWRGYDTLRFWLFSSAADDTELKILLYSDDTATELIDSYFYEFTVDWEGWRELCIPKHLFRVSRQPRGWDHIDHVTIAAGGWGLTAPAGARFYLDEMCLTREQGDTLTVGDFESTDTGWEGVTRSTEQAKSGEGSGKWSDLERHPFIRTVRIPADWTEWDVLEFSLYSEKANGQPLLILLYSNNPETDKVDSYDHRLTVNWKGWKQVSLRKPEFFAVRQPLGWQRIDNMTIAGSGWGLATKPDTVLYIDDVRLRRLKPLLEVE